MYARLCTSRRCPTTSDQTLQRPLPRDKEGPQSIQGNAGYQNGHNLNRPPKSCENTNARRSRKPHNRINGPRSLKTMHTCFGASSPFRNADADATHCSRDKQGSTTHNHEEWSGYQTTGPLRNLTGRGNSTRKGAV